MLDDRKVLLSQDNTMSSFDVTSIFIAELLTPKTQLLVLKQMLPVHTLGFSLISMQKLKATKGQNNTQNTASAYGLQKREAKFSFPLVFHLYVPNLDASC